MRFADAKAVISSVVHGQYFSMTYRITQHTDGTDETKCSCFTIGDVNDATERGYGTKDYQDWAGVIKELEEHFHTGEAVKPVVEEMP